MISSYVVVRSVFEFARPDRLLGQREFSSASYRQPLSERPPAADEFIFIERRWSRQFLQLVADRTSLGFARRKLKLQPSSA
ncbi:hypothetical protein LCM4579_23800 [Ensifer sp. LCM 4579]|nr:hypothetical protein LCM4579_23800 [Ensifer sp. LCM 4579]